MSREDKDFLTDDIFDTQNDNQNTDVDSLEENSEEILWGNFDETKSNISDEADNFEKMEQQNNSYSSQFDEIGEFVYNGTDTEESAISQKQSKPLSTKKITIIAVVAILAIATIALGVYFVCFNRSIESGVWIPVTIDEKTNEIIEPEDKTVTQYYKFTDKDMIIYYSNGYAENESSYEITYEKDNTIVVNDGTDFAFKYDVSGNLIEGKLLTLTVAGVEDQPITFKWSKETSGLTGPDFTKNDEILGYWKYDSGNNIVYKEFTKDGVTNEYAVHRGTCQKYSQKYNFDGENIVTLSPGGTDVYGTAIEPGTEEKNKATIDGNKLTLYVSDIPYEFTKSSKEEYEEFKAAAIAGTYEYPTEEYQVTTEAITEVVTELATEAVTAETDTNA